MMKRIDILIALGIFLILLCVHIYLAAHGQRDEMVDTFLSGVFGALLALFQREVSRRPTTDVDTIENVNVLPQPKETAS